MILEALIIMLAVGYVIAHAVAYAFTESRPIIEKAAADSPPARNAKKKQRKIAWGKRAVGSLAIVAGMLASARGLLMLLHPETLARMPNWVKLLADAWRPLTDLIPAFLLIIIGWWAMGFGAAAITARTRKRRNRRPESAGVPKAGAPAR